MNPAVQAISPNEHGVVEAEARPDLIWDNEAPGLCASALLFSYNNQQMVVGMKLFATGELSN